MAGLFSRLKTWVKGENLKSSDLNAEFNNIISNIGPTMMSGYSASVSQMRIQTNPGSQGSESLAATTSDEIERLRYVINRIIGGTFWYDTPALSISQINTLVNSTNTIPQNRIESGLKRATSNQPAFLVADGTATTVRLKGSTTPFKFIVSNTEYTISTDVALTGLSAAASSATALVNDSSLTAQATSKTVGENYSSMNYDTPSGNFSSGATVGTFQAFKITHAAVDEYFIGFVNSSTQITKCFRGYFFDSSSAPVPRIAIADNDTITLLRLGWIFAKTTGTLDVTYNNPKVSFEQPGTPSSNDYWFDLNTQTWKVFSGGVFVAASAILVGIAVQDTTKCVVSRSFEFYAPYSDLNSIVLDLVDTNTLRAALPSSAISVAGNTIRFDQSLPRWVMPDNLDSGLSELSSTNYFVYVKDTGAVILSDVEPHNRFQDLFGKYHPYNPWRCIGSVLNDGSSNFTNLDQEKKEAVRYDLNPGATTHGPNPNCINLGLRYSSGTLTICAADQSDLSPLNLGYVFIGSALNPGKIVKLRVASNITVKDLASGSSDLSGIPMGLTASFANTEDFPLYLYATNLDDTNANLAFFISRIPNQTFPGDANTNLFGFKGTPPATSNYKNSIFLLSSTPNSGYTAAPICMIGGFAAISNSSNNLTIKLTGTGANNRQVINSRPHDGFWWKFMSGQNGPVAGQYVFSASGTAPAWGSNQYYYSVSNGGLVNVDFSFAGTCTNGSSAIQVKMALPFPSMQASFTRRVLGPLNFSGAGQNDLLIGVADGTNSAYSLFSLSVGAGTSLGTLINTSFGNAANTMVGSFSYQTGVNNS